MILKFIKKFFQEIFSIRNEGTKKIIRFLGLHIKFDRTISFKDRYMSIPIQKNKIVFNNFNGVGYGCNPKYIAEEIIKRGLPYDLVWICDKKHKVDLSKFPKNVRVLFWHNKETLKEFVNAKLYIGNVRFAPIISRGWEKRNGQKYIQTWHGSLGIKKIDASVKNEDFKKRLWCDFAKIDSKYIDYCISNSDFEDRIFSEGLWYDGEIIKLGHSRNDVFFKSLEETNLMREKVFDYLGIEKNKKTLLYAPSFRDSYRLDCYNIDLQRLTSQLGDDWCVVVRMHPRLKRYCKKFFKYNNDNIINGSYYDDIQELLVASDMMITDYSSCIFDFMLSRKPAFIFATDIEKYTTERGFYYPLESTPFPVATNNEELIKNIQEFNLEEYQNKVEKFLQDKGCMEDGHASERVVDLIEKIMEEDV